MLWQDIVIPIVHVIFAYSLVYQVYHGFKHKKPAIAIQTALLTSLGLYTLAFVFITLSLYFSAISSFTVGTLWLILLFQTIIYKRNK